MPFPEATVFTTEQVRAVLETLRAAVIITDAEGKFLVFNDAAERIMGSGAKDITPSQWADIYGIFHPDRVTPYATPEYPLMRALRGNVVVEEEMFIRNPNVPQGTPITVSAAPLRDDDGGIIGAVATIFDISPIKHIEGRLDAVGRQLVQAQKMEAVGRLAGGVAHDFNNQLSVILSFTHLAINAMPEDSSAREDMREVLKAGERAAALTRQLLTMSRRQVASPKVVIADEVVRSVEKMLRRVIGEDVELKIKLDSHDACIVIDPTHLEQVLINLAINSRDAMPTGGLLSIETSSVDLDQDSQTSPEGLEPGPHLCISVTDSGEGMSAETREHVFEPFFTTKPAGKGTGLGLSIVHGIVKQADGHVVVYSEPGRGTCFKLYFPRVDRSVTRVMEAQGHADINGTGRTVLLVEDDEKVRAVAARILRGRGFEVYEAGEAQEARSIALSAQKHIDVLLSDVVMPGLSGPELAKQLSRLLPELRVVLMSGYPADALLHRQSDLAKAKLISKPFTPDDLLAAVMSVLEPRHDTGKIETGNGTVLLVEDDEQLRKLTTKLLQARDYTVVGVGTVADGLAEFSRATVDLVLSDINLPDAQGIELLKQIRQRDMDVPVILVTGAPDLNMATEAVRYGAFRFLSKPVANDELVRTVDYAVRVGRLAKIKRDALNLAGKADSMPRDLAGLELCFDNVLASLWVEFQPILGASERSARAFEVLLRNSEPSLRSPPSVISAAVNLHRLPELGRCIRRKAAEAFSHAPVGSLLFVNLLAQDLEDKELFDPEAPLSKFAARVVLEITEREAIEPGAALERRIAKLRALGYRIAVDDLGAGYAGLTTFATLSPEIVKLDMSLVRDIDGAIAKQKTVGAMVELCQSMGIKVVAEGVETVAERDCLVKLGCDYMQGYYFARPSREFVSEFA
jgi:PAS domain S-box-containing protein